MALSCHAVFLWFLFRIGGVAVQCDQVTQFDSLVDPLSRFLFKVFGEVIYTRSRVRSTDSECSKDRAIV